MKLTTERLKQIIKEELTQISENAPVSGGRELAEKALQMSTDAQMAVMALEEAIGIINNEGLIPSDVGGQEIR